MRKYICLIAISILLVTILPMALCSSKDNVDLPMDYWMDGTEKHWGHQNMISKKYPGLTGQDLADALFPYNVDSSSATIGDKATFWNLMGADLDIWCQVPSTCRGVGEHCYVYVEDAEWNGGNGIITQDDVDGIIESFDSIIYPMETNNFRVPPTYNEDDKITIFLTDIKDGWMPGQGWYAGYFYSADYDSSYPYSNNRHMINIDTYPSIEHPLNGHDTFNAMGVVAHEYQHLLHFWSDPDETTWINEGQSDYAEFLTLGILEDSHLAYFFAVHSVNLEIWESYDFDIVENYGAALSFMMYLYENFGGAQIMSSIHNDTLNGRASIESHLPDGLFFPDVFRDWTLANLLDDPSLKGPCSGAALGYDSFDIPNDTWGYDVLSFDWDLGPFPLADTLVGMQDGYPSPDEPYYWVDDQQPLDANYFRYTNHGGLSKFRFEFLGNGFEDASYQIATPSEGGLQWYSGSGNGLYGGNERVLYHEFDFSSTTSPEMIIDTWMDIEYGWDFGYVEISTNYGKDWERINDTTGIMKLYRDPYAHVGYDGAYAFTGEGREWALNVKFDLSNYSGCGNVTVRFSYYTDDYYSPFGWIVDNIRVQDGETILDGTDKSDLTWKSDGWVHTDTMYPLDWSVYVVGYPNNGTPSQNDIWKMRIDPITGDGQITINGLGTYYEQFVIVPTIVSDEHVNGHFPYFHKGACTSVTPSVVSSFSLYLNYQDELNSTLTMVKDLISLGEEKGLCYTDIEKLLDRANDDISCSNFGVNWIFRSGKVMNALETLQKIIDIMTIRTR